MPSTNGAQRVERPISTINVSREVVEGQRAGGCRTESSRWDAAIAVRQQWQFDEMLETPHASLSEPVGSLSSASGGCCTAPLLPATPGARMIVSVSTSIVRRSAFPHDCARKEAARS
jgi:hypothetical protein